MDLMDLMGLERKYIMQYIEKWLLEYKYCDNTIVSYRHIASCFIDYLTDKNIQLTNVSRENVQQYKDYLFTVKLTESSVNLHMQVLAIMFEYLIVEKIVDYNPAKRMKNKIVKNQVIEHYLTKQQFSYILQYINRMQQNKERTLWIFKLLYFTACRRAEISDAKMCDFFCKNDKWWFKVVGKGNKYGEIPVSSDLLLALIEYRKFLGLPDYPSEYEQVPLISVGYSMLYRIVKDICVKVADELGSSNLTDANILRSVSVHWLRHTSATHQVDAGIDIRVVKENLRHAKLETTMLYQHIEKDKRHNEMKKFCL